MASSILSLNLFLISHCLLKGWDAILLLNCLWMQYGWAWKWSVYTQFCICILKFHMKKQMGNNFLILERLFCDSWCWWLFYKHFSKYSQIYSTCILPFSLKWTVIQNRPTYQNSHCSLNESVDICICVLIIYLVFPITKFNLGIENTTEGEPTT